MKVVLVSLVLVGSAIAPVRAMTKQQMQACASSIQEFEQFKTASKNDFYSTFKYPETSGYQMAVDTYKHLTAEKFLKTRQKCGSDYNMQSVAKQLYRTGNINTPIINDYIDIR